MADKLIPSPDDTGAVRRFRDMGDGTWAEVVSQAAGAAGAAAYPAGSTPVAATASGANAIATATLPAAVGKRTYITGLQFTSTGATAANSLGSTLAGVLGGTQQLIIGVPAGVASVATPLFITFNPPLPAAADNTAIVFSVPALGAGHAGCSASIQGFQL